jgi:hypothetical protein
MARRGGGHGSTEAIGVAKSGRDAAGSAAFSGWHRLAEPTPCGTWCETGSASTIRYQRTATTIASRWQPKTRESRPRRQRWSSPGGQLHELFLPESDDDLSDHGNGLLVFHHLRGNRSGAQDHLGRTCVHFYAAWSGWVLPALTSGYGARPASSHQGSPAAAGGLNHVCSGPV